VTQGIGSRFVDVQNASGAIVDWVRVRPPRM
jgi:hypothetical protein